MQGVCYNCFRYIPEGSICPYCGYDPRPDEGEYRIALKPGTPLANRYLIGRVLGQGGFGVTYVALDSQTRARVAIKEYLPTEYVSREADGTSLLLNSQNQQADFEYGKQQFLAEARTLAAFIGNEHIVGIHTFFEANGTAYFAMEFVEGVNLKKYMEQYGGPLPVHEANRILLPIMEALDWVHSKGIVHRDIAPDNIMIKRDGTARLIDFGAARYSTGEKSKSLDVVLKHGFAPYEQYSRRGRQGPFTDVYAMAATYYYAITGKVPPDAVDRMDDDELVPPSAVGASIRRNTEQVLLKALSVSYKDRYQKMSEFYSALLETMPLPFSPEAEAENYAAEKQEMAYYEACRLQETAKTVAEYKAAIRQFEKVKGYRDSADRLIKCSDAISALKEEEYRQKEEQQRKKEAETKARAEEMAAKRSSSANTQTQKKPKIESETPKKKKLIPAVAVLMVVVILLGVFFSSGILKKIDNAHQGPETQSVETSKDIVALAEEPESAEKERKDSEDTHEGTATPIVTNGSLIGISMPTKDLQRWYQDGENLKAMLEAAGYEVDLQYGANDIPTQVSQIENMIANGCKVLVIAAIGGDSLGTVLAQAKENGIPVIAYDRLIMNSDAVSYYATFDNWLVGVTQGNYIKDALDLDNAEGPFNIEFITGPVDDINIYFYYYGAMSVLEPYLVSGKLVCPSGQTEVAVVATSHWATDAAQARFENILATNYADDTPLHAVLASNDSTALGVENALASSYTGDVYPVITGQDCDIAIMKNLIESKQAMSVFKDTRTLAAKVVEMVDALMKGAEPPINDTETYDNGTGIIPSFLCEPVVCTVDNYEELLIDSGYYTMDQIMNR